MQRPGKYSVCLSGQKIFSYHICYENLAKYSRVEAKVLRLFSAKTDQYACDEACIKWLNEVGTFVQGSKGWRKI